MEDSSGHEMAADRTLWYNLLDAARLLRERLTSDPKSSFNLKAGCCDADPSFKHTVEVSLITGNVDYGVIDRLATRFPLFSLVFPCLDVFF